MTAARASAAVVLALRIAYGAGLVLAPERLTGRWLGPAAESAGGRVAATCADRDGLPDGSARAAALVAGASALIKRRRPRRWRVRASVPPPRRP